MLWRQPWKWQTQCECLCFTRFVLYFIWNQLWMLRVQLLFNMFENMSLMTHTKRNHWSTGTIMLLNLLSARVNLLFKTSSNHKSFVEFYQCIEFIYSRVCWFFMCVVRLTMCHVMTDRVTSFTPIFSTISVMFVGCQLFLWH